MPAIDQLEACAYCTGKPVVSPERRGQRKTVFHLTPCCTDARHLLIKDRPEGFWLDPSSPQGPASEVITPFESRSRAVVFWNQLMRGATAGA